LAGFESLATAVKLNTNDRTKVITFI